MERLGKWSEDRPEAVPSGCGGRQRIPSWLTVLCSASHAQRIAAVANALCVRTATVSSQDCIRAAMRRRRGLGTQTNQRLAVHGRRPRRPRHPCLATLSAAQRADDSCRPSNRRVWRPLRTKPQQRRGHGVFFLFSNLESISGAARRHSGAQPYCCGNEMRHWLLCTRTHARRLPLDAASTDAYTCHCGSARGIDRSCTSGYKWV